MRTFILNKNSTTVARQKLQNVHSREQCKPEYCCLHKPSNHHMRNWPMNWRADRYLMERICEHKVGHPDPDDLAFKARTRGYEFAYYESIHGCCQDECCNPMYWIKLNDI